MKHINELQTILNDQLNWNKARIGCLVQILQALFIVRTVNLTQIAAAFLSNVKEESSYRRVCRFFTNFTFDFSLIVPFVIYSFNFGQQYSLILDRTNWKWGKTPINILMLSIAYRGISIPLFWSVLDLEGNSCVGDRTSLLIKVLKKFGSEKIKVLLADREFVGKEWFNFLLENAVPFLIRIKESFLIECPKGNGLISIKQFIKESGRKKRWTNHRVTLWGFNLYISIRRKRGNQESMILISNKSFDHPFKCYKERWGIETLFGCLKGRGFRMEDTHITDPDKIEKLIFVLAIAFCWAYMVGEFRVRTKPIKLKKHGRKSKSVFRYGLDFIRGVFLRSSSQIQNLKKLLRILNPFDIKRYEVML